MDDIIVRDRDTDNDGIFDEAGAVANTRVSLSSGGAQATGHSRFAALSADGRYVAFESDATTLVSGDTNAVSDIFLRDRQTGQTVRVSLSATGAQANGPSSQPAIAGDGTVVIFQSNATNLVTGDTNGVADVFAYDKVLVRPTATPTPTVTNTPTVTPTPSRTPTITPTALPGHSQQNITYTYDPLYRLTAAEYSDGGYFRYSYDAVGNRLSEQSNFGNSTYVYDIANRLTSVNGVNYTWDANGNLLNDGVNTYTYDTANRLVSITAGASTTSYAYNGTGDRRRQTTGAITTTYTLDLNAGLTQVLADGTNTYLYGNGRIGELQPGGFLYHLPDALGSVRQLSTSAGAPSLSQTFKPFGERMTSGGSGTSSYGFTGEWQQGGTVYLRARYYAPASGRFLTRDTWSGDNQRPMSYNAWLYGYASPLNYADPTGKSPCSLLPPEDRQACEDVSNTGNTSAPSNPAADIASVSGLPICTDDLLRHGEPCIPVHCLFPRDLLHPLAPEPPVPMSNKGLGKWFHYLLQNVPGWWNRDRKAKREEVVLNLIAISFATEVSEGQADGRYPTVTRLVGYMAEAYARKGWSWPNGFYSFIGSREAVFNRMMPTLFANLRPDPNNPDKRIGDWETSGRAKRFTDMMNALQPRLNYGQHYARQILYTPGWHYAEANRPYEWGNVKDGNPDWFKQWINVKAPMLADGRAPLSRAHAGSAIWYAAPRGNPLASETGYVMTKGQQEELCNAYEQGCVGMPRSASRPDYIPPYIP